MNNYDKEYFIAFKSPEESVDLTLSLRSSNRYIGYERYKHSEPLFLDNQNEELDSNLDFKLHDAHMCGNSLIISNVLKKEIELIENDGVQIFPVVIINNLNHYDNYWIINIYSDLDLLNLSNCRIRNFRPGSHRQYIQKYSLDKNKVKSIDLNDRLVMNVSQTKMSYTNVHKSIVDIMKNFDIAPIKFISLDEWQMGVQFVE